MNLTKEELDKISRAGLTLDEAFYLWSLVTGSPLDIKLSHHSFEKLTKLGFLYQGEITPETTQFFFDSPQHEAKRFDEFFSIFPLDENDGSFVKVSNPRPIRIRRATTEILYNKLISEGTSEEDIIRTARDYIASQKMKPKLGETTFKYCRTPYNFLLKYEEYRSSSSVPPYYRKGLPKNDSSKG